MVRLLLGATLFTIVNSDKEGEPIGFHWVKGDELYQLLVAASSRGTGVAASLIGHAEAQLSKNRVKTAWLACAIGNNHAAHFYMRLGSDRNDDQLSGNVRRNFSLDTLRYEKRLVE